MSACKVAIGSRYQSNYLISPTHPTHMNVKDMQLEIEIHVCPLLPTVCGFFSIPQIIRNKCCEMQPMVYRPRPRRLEGLTFADATTKAALSPQLLKTLSDGLGGV